MHSDINNNREIAITRFLQLITSSQNRIYGYILSLVPHKSDADDIMQETTMIMWKKFDEFEPGSDFVRWAMAIARYRVLNFRRKQSRENLYLADEVVKLLDSQSQNYMHQVDYRLETLQKCVKKLNPKDRDMVNMKYQQQTSVKKISRQIGRSTKVVYKSLARIQEILLRCIRRNLATEEQV